mgnify:CR=1 FL=1
MGALKGVIPESLSLVLFLLLLISYFGFGHSHPSKKQALEKTPHTPDRPASTGVSDPLEKEMEIAKHVQQGLLTVETPDIPGVQIAARCLAATNVGGDFYTFINKQGHALRASTNQPGVIQYVDKRDSYLGVAIGDVAGHGVSAALVMALSSVIFRKLGKANQSPAAMFKTANQDIFNYISASSVSYVTAFYGVLDSDAKQFHYAKAGHVPALRLKANGQIEELSADGVFLGVFEGEDYEEKTIKLESKDRLILYTDGLTEARNKAHEQFGEDRFKKHLQETQALPIQDVVDQIYNAVTLFADGEPVHDDQTIVIMEVE